jgi:hypothetical protein
MCAWRIDQPELIRHDLDDLELLGSGPFTIGVPEDSPTEFKRMVLAGAKAFQIGNKSIDYTLRTYGSHWDVDQVDIPTLRMRKAIQAARKHVVSTIDYVMAVPSKPNHTSLFACTAALFRLQNTFRAAVITIKSGLHFETASLLRMIMEQLAWIVKIRDMTPDKGNYFQISPQSCIGDLKRLVPEAGRIYGELSGVAHLYFEETKRYIRVEDGQLYVHLHGRDLAWLDTLHLLVIADLFSIVGEWTFSDQIKKHRYIERKNLAEWQPKSSRAFPKSIERYKAGVLRDIAADKRRKKNQLSPNSVFPNPKESEPK